MDSRLEELKDMEASTSIGHSPEDSLWKKFKEGDEHAFALLYKKYINVVFNYSKIFSSDEALNEDCIQELFIDLWRRRQFLGKVVSVRFYLFKAIKRKIRLEQARQKRMEEKKNSDGLYLNIETSKEDKLIANESEVEFNLNLASKLALLSDSQREAIYLKYYKDMTPQEISIVMVENVSNVYKLISRGIDVLKKNMNKGVILFLIMINNLA